MPLYDDLAHDLVTTNTSNETIQQDILNYYTSTGYTKSSNAVKLLPVISNNNGKIKLYTEVNTNIKVGDRVFIMYNDISPTMPIDNTIILDNYLEFSGCTDWMYLKQTQGYEVIEVNESNNEITINRYFNPRLIQQDKKLYDHYISKIYIRRATITGGEIDGAEIRESYLNNTTDTQIDIDLVQSIIFSGSSYHVYSRNKYDMNYVSINSVLSTTGITSVSYKPYKYKNETISNQDPTPVSSYYSKNNNNYGYNYIHNAKLEKCRIDNGYYKNSKFVNCNIEGGNFTNCIISGCTVNDGIFINSTIDSSSYWFYGQWSGSSNNFSQDIWYNGVWNSGDFINKEWRNGIFNDGFFSGKTWTNGIFQNGIMQDSIWINGKFNGGNIINTEWNDGVFNGGTMTNCNWYDGTCNGGTIQNSKWYDGIFNGGNFLTGFWYNGTFNNGYIYKSYWNTGTFKNGIFNSENNATIISNRITGFTNSSYYWNDGEFINGVFKNSYWKKGTFYNGTFEDGSLWSGGTFKYGNFKNSSWLYGTFENGNVTSSYFHNVKWLNGNWNSGQIGIKIYNQRPVVTWSGGTFNSGIFGDGDDTSDPPSSYDIDVNWINGNFYGGNFYSYYNNDCTNGPWTGGFYGGIFYGGNFYGTFFGGTWMAGNFLGCNKAQIKPIQSDPPLILNPYGLGGRRYGEGPINYQQNTLFD